MRYKKIYLILALMVIGAPGCKKIGNIGPRFTMDNNSGTPIYFDVYGTLADYENSTNALMHVRIPANGSADLPTSKLTKGSWYYYDTYSDDYMYTNWFLDDSYQIGTDSTTGLRFKYNGVAAISVAATDETYARKSLLKNTGSSSTWIAVDALDLSSNYSIWSTLSAEERYAKLVVRKNHTCSAYYLYGSDTSHIDFSFGADIGYPVFTLFPTNLSFNFFMTNTNVNPNSSLYEPPCIDTCVTLFNGNLYVLVRQN